MKNAPIVAVLVAGTLVSAASAQSKPTGKMSTRTVFVTVKDRGGAPVLDLGQIDFDITEQGAKRAVVRAGLAKDPMRIALVVDTSDGAAQALNHLRMGLAEFIDA